MVICFNSTKEKKDRLDRLLQLGGYDDYGEAISSAVENALMLQEQIQKEGSIIIEPSPSHGIENPSQKESLDSEAKDYRQEDDSSKRAPTTKIPAVFRALDSSAPTELADLPSDMWMNGQQIPLDRWLFGQYNKILPAKATCRALGALVTSGKDKVLIEEAVKTISEAAVQLGDFLRKHDQSNELKRGSTLATAFPTSGKGLEKSRNRYANQFVANTNKNGQLNGLLFDLKLINRSSKSGRHITLTQPGWQFAKLPNPVLDDFQSVPTQKFSSEEKRMLLGHITRSVPVEDYTYRSILQIIADGITSPGEIDAALRERVTISNSKRSKLSESFLSSQRSGAVSRMEDLGLLNRIRNGIRIFYEITEPGQNYLLASN